MEANSSFLRHGDARVRGSGYMNSYLNSRALGLDKPSALRLALRSKLLCAIQPAPGVEFDGAGGGEVKKAHAAGVNSLAIEKWNGRFLLSGGANSSIKIWDLEAGENVSKQYTLKPAGQVPQSTSSHKYGITHVSFYPFDALAFLSSSYDRKLKIYDSTTVTPSASFDMDYVIYSHAMSPIARHLLVACATHHPTIRLADLRSGANAHSLPGHHGPVISVAWSPRYDHILASAGADGTARVWDIRKANSGLGVLDLEDAYGIVGYDGQGTGARPRTRGKAHMGAVNGIAWTDSGDYMVTTGHDEKIRVWDAETTGNTLVNFGPAVRNTRLATCLPLLAPARFSAPGTEVMFFPSDREILMYSLLDGKLVKRLRVPGATGSSVSATPGPGRVNPRDHITALGWRGPQVEMYSGCADGKIRAWTPRTLEDRVAEEEEKKDEKGGGNETESDGDDGRKRKRNDLEDIYQSLTRQRITFG